MNTPSNDGGPAFPQPDVYHPSGQIQYGTPGMSLRDWFAGQALAGMWACSVVRGNARELAETAYRNADAMIAARQKGTQ